MTGAGKYLALGVLAGRCGWLEKMSNRTGASALAVGILFAIGNYVRGDGAWNGFVWHWFGIYESLMCIFISFGLLWLFREFANWSDRFWRWSSAQSYGAYVFHLLLMLVLQNATDGLWLGAFGKFLFIGVVTTVLSFFFHLARPDDSRGQKSDLNLRQRRSDGRDARYFGNTPECE